MRECIERVPVDELEYDRFIESYLLEEHPVLITGVSTFDAARLTPEYVKSRFADPNSRQSGWFDSKLMEDDRIRIPSLVKRVLSRRDIAVRAKPFRLFMQPGGHVTLPHYDGNSLHGFNLQVIGEKHWIVTSPRTPLPAIPFAFVGMVGKNFSYDERKYHFLDFTTRPGDMLFLPRYWYHEVHSLGQVNLNVNWVFTPTMPNESTPVGRREMEILKIAKSYPRIRKSLFPDDLADYGGQGENLAETYSKGVSTARALTRLVKELAKYPRLIIVARQIEARVKEFSDNNFNV